MDVRTWSLFVAALINRATMALYYATLIGRAFCEFVEDAKVRCWGSCPAW